MTSKSSATPLTRAQAFASQLGIQKPLLLAPMAGACPPSLSIAVANAGGMGACGALLMQPDAIRSWVDEFRRQSSGAFQLNLWIPGPAPIRDAVAEGRHREFLARFGPLVPPEAGDAVLPNFDSQCEALLAARPNVISSIMGLYNPSFVAEMKTRGILWFATATTVEEACAGAAAGADAIIAQGAEAGGHRGSFEIEDAERNAVGLVALVPQIVDAVSVPVIATGGIADPRQIAAALLLGASAVMIGTAFLRSPEAQLHPAYAARLGETKAHQTTLTRAFTGRAGRSVATRYVAAASTADAPLPAPYPVQRGFTRSMRDEAARANDPERMQMWAGQSARLARTESAGTIAREMWEETQRLLS